MRCNNFNIKVFVEDTDFQGYVYHANYLKYFERARSQFLNDYDISQVDEQTKGLFVIKDLFIISYFLLIDKFHSRKIGK